MSFSQEEKRNLIMEHYTNPKFKKIIKNNKIIKHGQACADYLEFNFDIVNNEIKNLFFDAKGCAFMIASTDLLCQALNNKNVSEAVKFIDKYEFFIKNGGSIEQEQELGKLAIFNNVNQHPNRIFCATMLSNALKEKIDE